MSNEREQVGLMVSGMGIFFIVFGILMYLDRALLAGGNLMFVFGIGIAVGIQNAGEFFWKSNTKGSICLISGVLLVLIQWPIIGMLLELYASIVMFRNIIPLFIELFYKLPVIGPVLRGIMAYLRWTQ